MAYELELQQAIKAIKSGDRKSASQLLTAIIKANPHNETAWLYLASIQTDVNKQRQCLEQVLKLNPNNEAAKKRITQIENLQQSEVVPQPSLVQPSTVPHNPQDTIASTEPKKPEKPPHSEVQLSSTSVIKDDTKKCPFCAEAIKKEAKVCRYCGKDLTEQKKIKPIQQGKSDSQLINEFIAEKAKQGWVVVSQTNDSVQMKKPKRWSVLGLVLGFVLLIAFGAGLIILLLTVLDYALKKEKTLFITAAELREAQKGNAQRRGQIGEAQKGYSTLLILGIMGAVGVILFLCIGFSLISGTPSSNDTRPQTTKNTPTKVMPTSTPEKVLKIVDMSGITDGDYFKVNGIVSNLSKTKSCSFVRASVEYYDASGGLITTDETFIDKNVLGPGQTSTFSIITRSNGRDFETYNVSVFTNTGCD